MIHKVRFIMFEETEHELSISFAIDNQKKRVKTLILQRMPLVEEGAYENEKGVKVFMENDHFAQEYDNYLSNINISKDEVGIRAAYREYRLDISGVDKSEIESMKELISKQNHDGKFTAHFM